MAGEFGRTPKVSQLPGTTSCPAATTGAVQTVWFAGGGVKGGTVVYDDGTIPGLLRRNAADAENMAATIYQSLGIQESSGGTVHRLHSPSTRESRSRG